MAYATDDALVNQVAKAMCIAYWRGRKVSDVYMRARVEKEWTGWVDSARAQLNMVDQPAQPERNREHEQPCPCAWCRVESDQPAPHVTSAEGKQ